MLGKPIRPLPPLPVDGLNIVDKSEAYVADVIHKCQASAPFNAERVTRAVYTCAVTCLQWQINYYVSLPNYRPEWLPMIAERTIGGLMAIIPTDVACRLKIKQEMNGILKDWIEGFMHPGKDDAIAEAIEPASAPPERRAVIDAFIARVLSTTGRKISRTDIWTVA
jgi:hypothetical protein